MPNETTVMTAGRQIGIAGLARIFFLAGQQTFYDAYRELIPKHPRFRYSPDKVPDFLTAFEDLLLKQGVQSKLVVDGDESYWVKYRAHGIRRGALLLQPEKVIRVGPHTWATKRRPGSFRPSEYPKDFSFIRVEVI